MNGSSSESDALPLLSGVPVIGPLLFLIYIDGIKSINPSPDSHLTLYADSMLLYRLPVLIMSTCRKSSKIGMWADANYLQFIVEKCKVVRVTRKQTGTQPPALYLHGQPLQEVDSYKYLGVILSSEQVTFNLSVVKLGN